MQKRRAGLAIVLFALSGIGLGTTALAAPYWGPAEVAQWTASTDQRLLNIPHAGDARDWSSGRIPRGQETMGNDYLNELALTAQFLALFQVTDAGTNFGGIREGEHLPNIIQTDNTSEAIWVWTRYFEVTADNTYYPNIQAAFTYSLAHPAYLEEGGSSTTLGYYRMYNSGWAVKAEQKFRDVYNETTYKSYGDACGDYLRDHTLIRAGSAFYQYVNPPVLAWAMGNLYLAGLHESRADWINAAVAQSRDNVKVWVETEPALLANETWAMSGGATAWGMVNSYLMANPDSTGPWLNRYESYLDNASSPGDFETAWNGWYAYGHYAVGHALNDPVHLATYSDLTALLVSEDADLDGGIPAKPADTDQMDQTWVANYMVVFGLSPNFTESADVPELGAPASALSLTSAPNPLRDATRISFALPTEQQLGFSIHDAAGRRVMSLPSATWSAGAHSWVWDGSDAGGRRVPAGVYWLRATGTNSAVGSASLVVR